MTAALDAVLTAALEAILQPNVFLGDHKKAVVQAIGVISSQRAYTDRTEIEECYAGRVEGTRAWLERSKGWREVRGEDC